MIYFAGLSTSRSSPYSPSRHPMFSLYKRSAYLSFPPESFPGHSWCRFLGGFGDLGLLLFTLSFPVSIPNSHQ